MYISRNAAVSWRVFQMYYKAYVWNSDSILHALVGHIKSRWNPKFSISIRIWLNVNAIQALAAFAVRELMDKRSVTRRPSAD